MKTCETNFVSAVVPRVSSTTPRPSINVHTTRVAAELDVPWIGAKNGSRYATASAATSPTYIATPPIVGSGVVCTLRSFGS